MLLLELAEHAFDAVALPVSSIRVAPKGTENSMNQSRKGRSKRGSLKETLIAKSIELLDAGGVEAVTIRAVARAAGVSHAAPKNHFEDRRALLTALCIVAYEELGGLIDQEVLDAGEDASKKVLAYPRALIAFGIERPNRYRMLWRSELIDGSNSELTGLRDSIYDALVLDISSVQPIDSTDPHTIAIALWSMAHGYVSMRIEGMFEPHTDAHSALPRQDAILELFNRQFASL